MKVKFQLPEGINTYFTSTGMRLAGDPQGVVEVERYTQDYYDLMGSNAELLPFEEDTPEPEKVVEEGAESPDVGDEQDPQE